MSDFMKVVEVKAMDDFTLECVMSNGDVYKYDMSFLQEREGEVTRPLRDVKLFKQVWIEYGALEWPTGYGIHGDTVVRNGVLIKKTA